MTNKEVEKVLNELAEKRDAAKSKRDEYHEKGWTNLEEIKDAEYYAFSSAYTSLFLALLDSKYKK